MYQLLNEEGKRERALQMLLRVLYIDLSGIEGMQWYDMYRQGFYKQKEVRECFNIAIMLAPGILEPIKEFADIYTDDFVHNIYEQKLPVQFRSWWYRLHFSAPAAANCFRQYPAIVNPHIRPGAIRL